MSNRRHKIMVVEDDLTLRLTLTELLSLPTLKKKNPFGFNRRGLWVLRKERFILSELPLELQELQLSSLPLYLHHEAYEDDT